MYTLLKYVHYFAALVALTLVASCSSIGERTTTKTAYQIVIPRSVDRYELKNNQAFYLGERIGEAVLPVYPASELGKHLPEQNLCVEIVIDDDGRVLSSRPLFDPDGCSSQTMHPPEAFYEATEVAVKQWAFMPARICTFPLSVAKNDGCEGAGKVEYVPIRLAFAFTFTEEHGPRVTSRVVGRHE